MGDVRESLAELPPRDQQIALMSAHGAQHKEIANATNLTPSRVAHILSPNGPKNNPKVLRVIREIREEIADGLRDITPLIMGEIRKILNEGDNREKIAVMKLVTDWVGKPEEEMDKSMSRGGSLVAQFFS